MLCLTRRLSEVVVIGGGDSGYPEIRLMIVRVDGLSVGVGIEAPKDVPITRLELTDPAEAARLRSDREAGKARDAEEREANRLRKWGRGA